MNRRHLHTRRLPALIACLALFVVSSNYCLLIAWGGNTRMACLAVPRDAAAAPTCHHSAPAGQHSPAGKHSRQGDPNAGRSCCPSPVVAPSAPSLDKDAAVAPTSSAAFLAVVPAPSPLLVGSWHGRPPLPDGQPPTRFPSAPLCARAPPLA